MAEKKPTTTTGPDRKRKTVFERATARKKAEAARSRTSVVIGREFERWRQLKAQKGLRTDAMVALFLLDCHEKRDGNSSSTPVEHVFLRPPPPPVSTVFSKSLSDRARGIEELDKCQIQEAAAEQLDARSSPRCHISPVSSSDGD